MKKSVKGFGIIAFAALMFVIAGCNWENTTGYDIDAYELSESFKEYYEAEGRSDEELLKGAIASTNPFKGRQGNWVADETDLRGTLIAYVEALSTEPDEREMVEEIIQIALKQAETLEWFLDGDGGAYLVHIQNHEYGK